MVTDFQKYDNIIDNLFNCCAIIGQNKCSNIRDFIYANVFELYQKAVNKSVDSLVTDLCGV
jgi:hypothetical protein